MLHIERRNVTSCYHGSKISGSQHSFLTRRLFSLSKDNGLLRFRNFCYHGKVT